MSCRRKTREIPVAFAKGDRVQALWPPDGKFYAAVVLEVHKGKVHLQFSEDDTRKWLLPHQVKASKDGVEAVRDDDQRQCKKSKRRQNVEDDKIQCRETGKNKQGKGKGGKVKTKVIVEYIVGLEGEREGTQHCNDEKEQVEEDRGHIREGGRQARNDGKGQANEDGMRQEKESDWKLDEEDTRTKEIVSEMNECTETGKERHEPYQNYLPAVTKQPNIEQKGSDENMNKKDGTDLDADINDCDISDVNSTDDNSGTNSDSCYVPETDVEEELESEDFIPCIIPRTVSPTSQASSVPTSSSALSSTSDKQKDCDDCEITVASTHNEHGRKYDKRYVCYYCSKSFAKLPRHLKDAHGDESDVEDYLNETDKKKKEQKITVLRNLGSFLHNKKVLKNGKGTFLVTYRASNETSLKDYVFCKHCYATLAKTSIWKHSCVKAPKEVTNTSQSTRKKRVRKAGCILRSFNNMPEDLEDVLQGMRQDEVGKLVMKDPLILKFGSHLASKAGGDREQYGLIRGKMRQLGHLLFGLHETDNSCDKLSEYIKAEKFQPLQDTTKKMAGYQQDTHTYKTPSRVIRIGQSLKKVAEVKMASDLENRMPAEADECNNFLRVFDLKWSEMTANAHRNLNERKRNGVAFLPLTKDIMALNSHLNEEGHANAARLQEDTTDVDSFVNLSRVVLAKIILFNRKRQGEVSKIRLQDWGEKKRAEPDQAITAGLSDLEKGLLSTLQRLEIKGKRDRTVPILITSEVDEWAGLLLKCREHFIPKTNPYMFAFLTAGSHMRGSDVLREFALSCGAERPHLLTSTRLRKHLASMSQVLSLKEHEMDQLASFLGHDIRVHRQYYRLPLDVVQVARVSKVFLAAETGCIGEFAGKGLDEIVVSPDDIAEFEEKKDEGKTVVSDDDQSEQENMDVKEYSEHESGAPKEQEDMDFEQESEGNISAPREVPGVHDVGPSCSKEKQKAPKRKKKSCVKRKWSEREKTAVRTYFPTYIVRKQLPGKAEIEKFINENGINRQWRNVKDHIRNTYLA